jgi:hypothetical protein
MLVEGLKMSDESGYGLTGALADRVPEKPISPP